MTGVTTPSAGLAMAYIAQPGGRDSWPKLDEIRLLISCGADMAPLRAIAKDVISRFNQFMRNERRARFNITEWDYTFDISRDENVGHLADRSLEAVEECDGVIAIVGRTVPEVTRLEIRRVYELGRTGQQRPLWFFVSKSDQQSRPGRGRIALRTLLAEIETDFEKVRIYHEVDDELDFQASLMIEMLPFLISRTGFGSGPIGSGGGK